jgi:hypothetical protein
MRKRVKRVRKRVKRVRKRVCDDAFGRRIDVWRWLA